MAEITPDVRAFLSAAGRKGGQAKSARKAASSAANGKLSVPQPVPAQETTQQPKVTFVPSILETRKGRVVSAKISNELHRLKGSRPTRAVVEPAYSVAPGRPKMPRNLPEPQQVTFKRIRHLLEKRRACTRGDVEIIVMYCEIYERWKQALAKLEKEGVVRVYSRLDANGKEVQGEKKNLSYDVAQDSEKELTGLLDRLGMSPLNRGKVKPTAVARKRSLKKRLRKSNTNALQIWSIEKAGMAEPLHKPI